MMKIKPIKRLYGTIKVPGDKSISHRAVMLGAIARGVTRIKGLLDCDDCNYTIAAFKKMGIAIKRDGQNTVVYGKGLKGLKKPKAPIGVGSSGTTIRLLSGILAGQEFETILKSDKSLASRPMMRIVEPLSLMGVDIRADKNGHPPVTIKGGLVRPIEYRLPVPSAQVKSAILLAGLYAQGETIVEEAFKSRDHTERMLTYFGAKLAVDGLKVSIKGGRELRSKVLEIPGDISSASFFIVGAILLKGSRIKMKDVNINPTRAGILNILARMGADIKVANIRGRSFEPVGDIEVRSGATKGIILEEGEIPGIIDELPIIFVLAALSEGRTVIRGAGELKVKETDRIRSMKENLVKMGARIGGEEDEIIIDGVKALKKGRLKSFGDHRTCMAMTIAALTAKGESEIDDIKCVNKSFPGFFGILRKISR